MWGCTLFAKGSAVRGHYSLPPSAWSDGTHLCRVGSGIALDSHPRGLFSCTIHVVVSAYDRSIDAKIYMLRYHTKKLKIKLVSFTDTNHYACYNTGISFAKHSARRHQEDEFIYSLRECWYEHVKHHIISIISSTPAEYERSASIIPLVLWHLENPKKKNAKRWWET